MLDNYFYIFLLGLVPSLTWLIFYLQEDRKHPEPIRLIGYGFFLGALATLLVLVVQYFFRTYVFGVLPVHHPLEIITFSGIEEIFKFLMVFWFISYRKEFNEPLDAMVYMVTVALGFAAVENIATLGRQHEDLVTGVTMFSQYETLALRFFGATLLHSLASAIVGYHWAIALSKRRSIVRDVILGLSIAIILHATFNYLILLTGPISWVLSFVIFIGFFVLGDFEKLKAEDTYDT